MTDRGPLAMTKTSAEMQDIASRAKAWTFAEARDLAKRVEASGGNGEVLFETGYGPSGLPLSLIHI